MQRALTNNMSLEVAYVGNHGSKLLGIRNINQPPIGTGWTAALQAQCAASATDITAVDVMGILMFTATPYDQCGFPNPVTMTTTGGPDSNFGESVPAIHGELPRAHRT